MKGTGKESDGKTSREREEKTRIEQRHGMKREKKKRRDARIFQKVGLDSEKSGGVQYEAHDHGADDGGGKAAHAAVKDERRRCQKEASGRGKTPQAGLVN